MSHAHSRPPLERRDRISRRGLRTFPYWDGLWEVLPDGIEGRPPFTLPCPTEARSRAMLPGAFDVGAG